MLNWDFAFEHELQEHLATTHYSSRGRVLHTISARTSTTLAASCLVHVAPSTARTCSRGSAASCPNGAPIAGVLGRTDQRFATSPAMPWQGAARRRLARHGVAWHGTSRHAARFTPHAACYRGINDPAL